MMNLSDPPIRPQAPLIEGPDDEGLYPRDREYLSRVSKQSQYYIELVEEFLMLIRSFPNAEKNVISKSFHTALNHMCKGECNDSPATRPD